MTKTTNILDLNNRLEKVEKENVAQNSYTSLKNKPKINNVTLTGNKSSSDLGLAAAADLTALAGDVGNKANLTTTNKDDLVVAINELNSGLTALISKLIFGGYSNYYRTTETSIDGILNNSVIAPQTDDSGYFSAENKSSIVGFGNRQFVFGWTNTAKVYAWIIVCSFNGISVGVRESASAFTFTRLTS